VLVRQRDIKDREILERDITTENKECRNSFLNWGEISASLVKIISLQQETPLV